MKIAAHARTDTGMLRARNEDSLLLGSSVFAVADGLGGHRAGEVASSTAIETVARLDGRRFDSQEAARKALVEAVTEANRAVAARAASSPEYQGMGTTLTAALVWQDQLLLAHVGDSRAYLLRGGELLRQLTTDHTVVEAFTAPGGLTREEAQAHPFRHVLTRAIGLDREVAVDSPEPVRLEAGDRVLLCSDGLTGPVSDEEIAAILRDHPSGPEACRRLIAAANARGGPDNITVVLLSVEDGGGTEGGQP